ncbi:hypothetical protein ACFL5Z_18000 [Planctomycetota bacterium]
MNGHDTIKIGRMAKRETEVFINQHINDPAKGWPRTCLHSLVSGESGAIDVHDRSDSLGHIHSGFKDCLDDPVI